MLTRISRTNGVRLVARPLYSNSSIQSLRTNRRPLLTHFSLIAASFVSASAILSSFLLSLPDFSMSEYSNSQTALVRHLKNMYRFKSPRVERTLLAVDRRHFVDSTLPPYVIYQDIPLSIGFGETISAPHMHAACLDLLEHQATGNARILDVGSGSGYLTTCLAVLAGPNATIIGIEKHRELAQRSIQSICRAHSDLLNGVNPRVQILDGNVLSEVLNEMEAFDLIHVGAAAAVMPLNLVEKLKPGGRMVIPVGPRTSHQVEKVTLFR